MNIEWLMILILASCATDEKNKLSGEEVLYQSIKYHDPKDNWDEFDMSIRIQEPRIGNPSRYSVLSLNNQDHSFELIRNRDNHLSKHIIDDKGVSKVYLDDNEEISPELVTKYRLTPERNKGYHEFYKMLYGLPMSLDKASLNRIGEVESSIYNNQLCYKIPIELKEAMFSMNWIIYISKSKFEFKGMEIIFPDDNTKGERLYYEGSISIGDMRLPRIRHWHELSNNDYSGSDIIIGEL